MEINESISVVSAPKGGRWSARLIESEVQGSSAYYTAESLRRSVGKFKAGTHVYSNHMSVTEREERPEGDVNNLIGELATDGELREDGIYADLKIFSDRREWLMERANSIGLSIRAEGSVEESADGVPTLVEISKVHSVDVVTKAGAGGKFVSILESARNQDNSEALSEHKKEETELEISKEFIEALESQAKLTNELLEAMKADREAKVQEAADLAEAERKAKEEAEAPKAPTAAEVSEALIEADLSKTGRARVLRAVEAGADLAEAIKEEADLAKEILESAGSGAGHFEDTKTLSEAERSDKLSALVFG